MHRDGAWLAGLCSIEVERAGMDIDMLPEQLQRLLGAASLVTQDNDDRLHMHSICSYQAISLIPCQIANDLVPEPHFGYAWYCDRPFGRCVIQRCL